MILAKASLNYDRSFIVLATVITIVNYDRKTFIVQATSGYVIFSEESEQNLLFDAGAGSADGHVVDGVERLVALERRLTLLRSKRSVE